MLRSAKVLVVDDDQDIAEGAVCRLRAAGCETLVSNEGIAGVESAHRNHPDVIVLDMRMPTWDGLRVLRELRTSSDTNHIPVIMLSASLGDRQKSLHAGARLFLSKPYDGTMLVNAVKHVIDESHMAEAL